MQMMPGYRYDTNAPPGQTFPTFTFADPNTNEMDLDFNMLSEYLFNEEDMKVPAWNTGAEDLNGLTGSTPNDLSDQEGETDIDAYNFVDSLPHSNVPFTYLDQSSGDENETGSKRKKGDKSNKSQDQIDRRRERNRVLARKTRLRKKFFFEVNHNNDVFFLLVQSLILLFSIYFFFIFFSILVITKASLSISI